MSKTTPKQNKALVLEAFDLLFNKRDYARAEGYWSDRYIQHSAHIAPGREGLFDLVRAAPAALKYENQLIVAEGDFVILHVHSVREKGSRGRAIVDIFKLEDGKIVEHWDVTQEIPEKSANSNGMF